MSNIHGLGPTSTEKKDEENAYFEPGKSSGIQVQKPDKNISNDITSNIISKAKSNPNDMSGRIDNSIGRIKIYRNGFIIGNGIFRPATEPQNKKFLQALLKQELPRELEQQMIKEYGPSVSEFGVDVVDHHTEDYVEPLSSKPTFQAFQGTGQRLESKMESCYQNFASSSPMAVTINPNEPTTTLQLVLIDRRKVRQKFNLTHTVLDVYKHMLHLFGVPRFDMLAGFPPKPLSDPSLTIQQAGLSNSSIQQKAC